MTKKIGLIELYSHSEVLYNFCTIIIKTEDCQLAVFTQKFIYEDAPDCLKKSPSIQWFFISKKENHPSFATRNLEQLNECAVLIFVTIASNFRFYSTLNFQAKTILLVHNANAVLCPSKSIRLSLFSFPIDWLRLCKVLIFRDFYFKKKMLENFDYLSLPNRFVYRQVEKNGLMPSEKLCRPLPFAFFEGKHQSIAVIEKITIAIPGTITDESRDYELVFKAFKEAIPDFENPIQLALLGRPKGRYGRRIIRQFQSLECGHFEVTSFQKAVPQQKYDDWLRKSDFLILPLKRFAKYGIYREKVGFTKISGSVNDMIRFGKPALIPSFYPLEKELQKMVAVFSDAGQLAEKLSGWIRDRTFEGLRAVASEGLVGFSEERKRLELEKVIEDIFFFC